MDLIIQPEEVGILARPISQHIDREQLVAYITEVEQLQIRSALGGVLFAEIKKSPSKFDIILNGGSDEVGEVSGGIRKAMAYYVYARVIREGGTIATRFGAVEKNDEYATRLEQERKNTIYRECNNIADTYMVEVVNYAKAQGWMDAQGVNSTRKMVYVAGGEEAGVNTYTCKSRKSVNAELVAGDGINIVDGEISVDMGEVQRGTGMTALAQRVTNAETNIEEVRRLATQREEVTVGNGLIKDDKGSISVDFEVVASNAEITNIRTNANEAKTEAGQAKKLAENAISSLVVIGKIASDAETTAQRAKTEADSAVTTAVDAVGVAGSALTTAGQATTVANDALLKANSAQTSATNAENSAKSSAQSASSAKSSAEKAQASAEEVAKGIASIDGKVSESVSKAVDGAFDGVNQALAKQAEELATKAPKVGYAPDLKVDFAKELVGRGVAEPQEIGNIRPTGEISIGDGNATIEKVKGKSVVYNQHCNYSKIIPKVYGLTFEAVGDKIRMYGTSTNTLSPASLRITRDTRIRTQGHKYLVYDSVSKISCSLDKDTFKVIIHPYIVEGEYYDKILGVSIHDLTQMFGAGNEPSTIEEFEARKPLGVSNEYNEGEIISYDGANELQSVGFNAFNGTYAKVIGGQQYHALGTITSIGFTTELGGETTEVTLDSEGMFTPSETGYVYAEGSDICIHLTHTYTPEHTTEYEEDILTLPDVKSIKDKDGNPLFPYGLLSAGSAYDEITAKKAVKRIGVVDMGTLTWYTQVTANGNTRFLADLDGIKRPLQSSALGNVLTPKYQTYSADKVYLENVGISVDVEQYKALSVYDPNYTEKDSFKQAMQGVILYYELAEPIEVDLPEPLNLTYDAWDFGTEELVAEGKTTPLNAVIGYQFNAVDRIRENSSAIDDLEEHVEERKNDGIELLTNGNLKLTLKGDTREFMPATPSGDPMHNAYEAAGAVYNATDEIIVVDAPWKDRVDTVEYKSKWGLDVVDASAVKQMTINGVTYNYATANRTSPEGGTFLRYFLVGKGSNGVWVENETKVLRLPKCWYLNGLGDITDKEMASIYRDKNTLGGAIQGIFIGNRNRTLIDSVQFSGGAASIGDRYARCTFLTSIQGPGIRVSSLNYLFNDSKELKYVMTLMVATYASNLLGVFISCEQLRAITIAVKASVDLKDSPFLSKPSVQYMINKAAPTTAITITLHPDVFARIKDDADIRETLDKKNVELQATGGSVNLVSPQ